MNGFETDTDKLRDGANKFLDPLVDDLERAKRKIASLDGQDKAFSGGSGIFADIEPLWLDVQNYLERVLRDNAETLDLSSQALREIADRYDEVDQGNAEAMPG